MIIRPSMFDTRYQNMSTEDKLLNYNRDIMLYEQAEALNKIANAQNTHISNNTTIPYECFEPNNPDTYLLRNLNHKLEIYDCEYTPWLIVALFIAICLIPITLFITPNPKIITALMFIIPILFMSLLATRIMAKKVYKDINVLLNKYKNREC